MHTVNITEKRNTAFKHLKRVLEVLEKHRVVYWIEYGTLLGAVREKTAILWDSEFDLGIWNLDYVEKKQMLLKDFEELNFIVSLSEKDRVKLLHRESRVGAFTIDIHTYHTNDQIAYVSFNKKKRAFLQEVAYKVYNKIKLYDQRKEPIFRLGPIIKKLLSDGLEVPDCFYLIPGKFNSETSYKLIVSGVEYDMDKEYLNRINVFSRLLLKFMKYLPKRSRHNLIDFFEPLAGTGELTNDIQAIPLHYYTNLTKTQLGGLSVSCPASKHEYLESVYGSDWHVSKPNWNRSQNKINKQGV